MPLPTKNLQGQRFQRWVVVEKGVSANGQTRWVCRCDCGVERLVIAGHLLSGRSQSCGCLRKENSSAEKHGYSAQKHPVYSTWMHMRRRCQDIKHPAYRHYGGRGIKICDEWRDPIAFMEWALANGWKTGLSIDRIDNDGNYEPSNCHWATAQQQRRNQRFGLLVSAFGETHPAWKWAEDPRCAVSGKTLRDRLADGWAPEDALTRPPKIQRSIRAGAIQ